jgi:hypothetical protein
MRYPVFALHCWARAAQCALLCCMLPACFLLHGCRDAAPAAAEQPEQDPSLSANDPLLRLLSPEETGVTFQNRIQETPENNIINNVNMYNGGGMAVIDVNNDNLPDLYFIGCSGNNALYLNEGQFRFRDITASAGLLSPEGFETAATAVDINADGWMDLYVCRSGPGVSNTRRNRLYINNGDLTFTERAAAYGLDDISASTGANFFDYDNDGDLDLYLLNYPAEKRYSNKIESQEGPNGTRKPYLEPRDSLDGDRLYRNDNGRFTDVSERAGVRQLGYGLSVSVSDLNRDGYTDVYVCNDFVQPDKLLINQKNGSFSDQITQQLRHITHFSMGSDLADFDNDGLIDLLAIDMLPEKTARQKTNQATLDQSVHDNLRKNGFIPSIVRNGLQRNNGNGTFSDIGCLAGVYNTDWSWSGLMFDIDNDGFRDIHISNGYRRETINKDFTNFTLPELQKAALQGGPDNQKTVVRFEDFIGSIPVYKTHNYGFRNTGDWRFQPVNGQWLSVYPSWSCGAAWVDLDADGALDLVVNNLEQPAFIYKNRSRTKTQNHFLQIKLVGNQPNTMAVGASVRIDYGDNLLQYAENYPTRGIFSSVEHLIHFGLGANNTVRSLTVRWPDGRTQSLQNIPVNQRLTLRQSDARGPVTTTLIPPMRGTAIWQEVAAQLGLAFRHSENDYNDFEQYPMLPWRFSDQGPLLITGDVNGDGRTDVYVGNSFNQPAALFVQQPDGRFQRAMPEGWEVEKMYEDHGGVFFDADGDGDQDLLVLSGGGEARPEMAGKVWENRLYINTDGKGTFGKAVGAVPTFGANIFLRATAYDYDRDGDQDLFLGGRLVPGQWPAAPRSAVLRNDRNGLTDVTASVAPDLAQCGMIADMRWVNLDADPEPELVVVGEWMPVSVFDWQQNKLVNVTHQWGLSASKGLWKGVEAADLDGDGDMDLITGNLGLNTPLKASMEGPLRCYANDYDQNGVLDQLMAFFEDGKEYPLHQKEVLHKQMPVLKKRLLYVKDYAIATIDQVWPRKDLEAGTVVSAGELASCWWENRNGQFVRHLLPPQAQAFPAFAILTVDANADGATDILLFGNKSGFEVEINRCDSGNGCLLLNNGKGQFTWLDNQVHGLWAMGEVRDADIINGPSGKIIVVSNNNGPLQAFSFRQGR